jgi:hypothetical protein
MSLVVNIGYCQEHFKGGDRINQMHGQLHAEWLEQCVLMWEELCDCPVFVSMTGFTGWPEVENSATSNERDVLWRIFGRPRVRFVTMAANPGHQVGAAWCIRLGLEAAGKLGYAYMIHTAEDVVPSRDALLVIRQWLEVNGSSYVGEHWGVDEGRDECSSQFFGCDVGKLCGPFDPPAVSGHGHLEAYLRHLLPTGCAWVRAMYRSTHDFSEWQKWRRELAQC